MVTNRTEEQEAVGESGFILVILFMSLVPMLLVVGAFSVTMAGRSAELRVELDQERALLAAESGVDDAIYRGQNTSLVSGSSYTRMLGAGSSFTVVPTYLGNDTKDNDDDGVPDDADEDVFQVIVTGTFRQTRRRLAAYLGPVPLLPAIGAAVGTQNPNPTIVLQGTPEISGNNVNMNGTPAVPNVPGLAIVSPPATVATLLAELTGSEPAMVTGAGGPPSLGTIPPLDLVELAMQLQNMANIVLTSSSYSSYSFGNGLAGVANIAYRNGKVKFQGNSQGAGILVVTGDLELKGTFRFDGVIIVLGDLINSAGTAEVYGAILQGAGGSTIETHGTLNVHYSSEAIALANSINGRYVAFNGWQELAR